MNKEAAQKTAVAIGALFGMKAPALKSKVSRNKRTITRKDAWGQPVCLISFNEAKAALKKDGKVFESDAKLEKALWNAIKMKDGSLLRDSYASPTSQRTQYADE
jgi:hypothetical protein